MLGATSDGYYEEVRGGRDNTRKKPISARSAHGCWTGATQTSEDATSKEFGE